MFTKERIFDWLWVVQKNLLVPFGFSFFFVSLVIFIFDLYPIAQITRSWLIAVGIAAGYGSILILLNKYGREAYRKTIGISFWSVGIVLFFARNSFLDIGKIYYSYPLQLPEPITNVGLFVLVILLGILFIREYRIRKDITQNLLFNRNLFAVTLLLVFLIWVLLLSYNLGSHNFLNDEFATMESATNFLHTGDFWKWDWVRDRSGQYTECALEDPYCNYKRAEIHSILIATSYKVFGISEFSTRLVSVIGGLVLFGILAMALLYLRNPTVAVYVLMGLVLCPALLFLFRYARMYALLIPCFFGLTYILFRLIYEFENLASKKRLIYGLSAIILFVICYNLHSQTLFLILPLAVFCGYIFWKYDRSRGLLVLFLLGLCTGFLTLAFWPQISSFETATEFLEFSQRTNLDYIGLLFDYPLGLLGLAISTIMFIYSLFSKNDALKEFYVFSYLVCILPLFVLIFGIDRFSHIVYVSNLLPFAIFLGVGGCIIAIQLIPINKIRILLYSFLMLLMLTNLYSAWGVIYERENFYFADYSRAYASIVKNYNPETDAIFMGYSRAYYLRDLDYRGGPIHLFGNKDYSEEAEMRFLQTLQSYESGFITWDEFAAGDIKTSTKEYIGEHFKQLSGAGLDKTRVEVYYFNRTMFSDVP